ncbi:type II toxin-antitoxin system HicB family antitoxin [Vagococcus fluvialis]|uniref:type II toxin-antitoxin system HicB family antitoxin n=1 Tax=Vagococcus fluvialis TaxID=2738 RepID=UPI003B58F214
MELVEYVAVFQELNDQFYVFFPDLPGVETFGNSLVASKEEAEKILQDSIIDTSNIPVATNIGRFEELYPKDILSLVQAKI